MAVQGSAHAYILGVRGGGVAHVSTCMDVKAVSTLSTPEYLYKKEEAFIYPLSPVTRMRVLSRLPVLFTAATTLPTSLSISNNPDWKADRPGLFQRSAEFSGTCMCDAA